MIVRDCVLAIAKPQNWAIYHTQSPWGNLDYYFIPIPMLQTGIVFMEIWEGGQKNAQLVLYHILVYQASHEQRALLTRSIRVSTLNSFYQDSMDKSIELLQPEDAHFSQKKQE